LCDLFIIEFVLKMSWSTSRSGDSEKPMSREEMILAAKIIRDKAQDYVNYEFNFYQQYNNVDIIGITLQAHLFGFGAVKFDVRGNTRLIKNNAVRYFNKRFGIESQVEENKKRKQRGQDAEKTYPWTVDESLGSDSIRFFLTELFDDEIWETIRDPILKFPVLDFATEQVSPKEVVAIFSRQLKNSNLPSVLRQIIVDYSFGTFPNK
jgi:hypothetical protein